MCLIHLTIVHYIRWSTGPGHPWKFRLITFGEVAKMRPYTLFRHILPPFLLTTPGKLEQFLFPPLYHYLLPELKSKFTIKCFTSRACVLSTYRRFVDPGYRSDIFVLPQYRLPWPPNT